MSDPTRDRAGHAHKLIDDLIHHIRAEVHSGGAIEHTKAKRETREKLLALLQPGEAVESEPIITFNRLAGDWGVSICVERAGYDLPEGKYPLYLHPPTQAEGRDP